MISYSVFPFLIWQKCLELKNSLLAQQKGVQSSLEHLKTLIRLIQNEQMLQVTMTTTTTSSLLTVPWTKPSSASAAAAPQPLHSTQGNNWQGLSPPLHRCVPPPHTHTHFFRREPSQPTRTLLSACRHKERKDASRKLKTWEYKKMTLVFFHALKKCGEKKIVIIIPPLSSPSAAQCHYFLLLPPPPPTSLLGISVLTILPSLRLVALALM